MGQPPSTGNPSAQSEKPLQKQATKYLGDLNEAKACNYLENKGYEIVERNVRYKCGEVDIVATKDSILTFVEVRSKKNTQYGTPEASVNWKKQQHIVRVANIYLKRFNPKPICRFDIVAIVGHGRSATIKHIERAFVASRSVYPRRRSGNPWQAY